MKFSMMQSQLLETLQVAANAVPQKSTLPILSHLLVEAKDGTLSLTATDLDLSIRTSADVSVDREGRVAVPARKLLEMVRELPPEFVEVVVEKGTATFTFGGGAGRFHLVTAEPDDFPQIPKMEGAKKFTLPLKSFERAVERTVYAVSGDEMRPEMNGVLFQLSRDKFNLVATNGHRLARASVAGSFSGDADVIVPPKALHQVLRLAGGKSIGDLQVTMSKQYVLFEIGKTRIYSRLIEGMFPNYEHVIPRENKKKVTIHRELLTAALKRVAILADTITHQVKLSFSPGKAVIDVSVAGVGGGQETLDAEYQGEALDVGFNAHYILDILRSVSSETVVFSLNTPVSAALVTPGVAEEGEDLLCLVMPLRLPE
jgi:DNA polymerase-3 subunit beta